jgi:ABC-type multidrug transport system permease subunit
MVLVRGIYLALPYSSVSTNDFLLQYFLFELPTFLFFSTYTIVLYLW